MNLSNYKFLLETKNNYLLDYRILLYNFIKLILQDKIKKKGEIVCLNKNGNINLLNFMNNKVMLTKVNKFSDVFRLNINIKNKLKIAPFITIKVIPLSYKDRENMYNPRYPVWRELQILKIVSKLSKKRISPNLPLIYNYYICNSCNYINPNLRNVTDKICLLVLSEYNKYDFRTWLINLSKKKKTVTELENIWYNIIFQIVSVLYLLYKLYRLVHLDLHWGNLLVQTHAKGGYWTYRINGINYYLPNLGFTIKLWDFGKSRSKNIFEQDSSISINDTIDIIRFSNIYIWINKYDKIKNKSVIPSSIIELFQSFKKNENLSLSKLIYIYMGKFIHNKIGQNLSEIDKKNLKKVNYSENFTRGEIVSYKNKYALIQDIFKFKIYIISDISNYSYITDVNSNDIYKILTNVSQNKNNIINGKNNGIYII